MRFPVVELGTMPIDRLRRKIPEGGGHSWVNRALCSWARHFRSSPANGHRKIVLAGPVGAIMRHAFRVQPR